MKRRSVVGTAALIGAVLVAWIAAPAVARAEERPNDEVGVLAGVGFADSDLVGTDRSGTPGPILGARYGHEFTDSIGVSTDLLYGASYSGDLAYGDWSELSVGGAMDWFFASTKRTRWFGALGGESALQFRIGRSGSLET